MVPARDVGERRCRYYLQSIIVQVEPTLVLGTILRIVRVVLNCLLFTVPTLKYHSLTRLIQLPLFYIFCYIHRVGAQNINNIYCGVIALQI
mmetsp:Transcript_1147/g.3795  ORF Transcript_1147/g.3795 Transcript_1147/m.3795 type:complete len:91 (+) Transcript_1147:1645-1917(+)